MGSRGSKETTSAEAAAPQTAPQTHPTLQFCVKADSTDAASACFEALKVQIETKINSLSTHVVLDSSEHHFSPLSSHMVLTFIVTKVETAGEKQLLPKLFDLIAQSDDFLASPKAQKDNDSGSDGGDSSSKNQQVVNEACDTPASAPAPASKKARKGKLRIHRDPSPPDPKSVQLTNICLAKKSFGNDFAGFPSFEKSYHVKLAIQNLPNLTMWIIPAPGSTRATLNEAEKELLKRFSALQLAADGPRIYSKQLATAACDLHRPVSITKNPEYIITVLALSQMRSEFYEDNPDGCCLPMIPPMEIHFVNRAHVWCLEEAVSVDETRREKLFKPHALCVLRNGDIVVLLNNGNTAVVMGRLGYLYSKFNVSGTKFCTAVTEVSSPQRLVFTTGTDDMNIIVTDMEGKTLKSFPFGGYTRSICTLLDGSIFTVNSNTKTGVKIDVDTEKMTSVSLEIQHPRPFWCAPHPNGFVCVLCIDSSTVYFIDPLTGKSIQNITTSNHHPTQLKFHGTNLWGLTVMEVTGDVIVGGWKTEKVLVAEPTKENALLRATLQHGAIRLPYCLAVGQHTVVAVADFDASRLVFYDLRAILGDNFMPSVLM